MTRLIRRQQHAQAVGYDRSVSAQLAETLFDRVDDVTHRQQMLEV
jgi:hypothetical protein